MRGPFQSDGGDTGTDTEVSEQLRGHGATRTLVTRDLQTDIDLGCDKVEQCLDKSDEVDCKIFNMRCSYGKSIAPFSFDYDKIGEHL